MRRVWEELGEGKEYDEKYTASFLKDISKLCNNKLNKSPTFHLVVQNENEISER